MGRIPRLHRNRRLHHLPPTPQLRRRHPHPPHLQRVTKESPTMTDEDLNNLFPLRPLRAGESQPLVLTVEQAADRLGVGRTVMYALVSSGAVESVQIGRLRRIPSDALVTFLDELRGGRKGGAA